MIPIVDIIARLSSRGLAPTAGSVTDLVVTGVSDDSRRVQPGDLYCAIRGYADDGHRYLRQAAEAGALAALVEVETPDLDLLQIQVTDTRRAAAIAAQIVFGDPVDALDLIGVTGTNGKTTTVRLAQHVLSGRAPTASIGTLGVLDARGESWTTGLTTPGPIELARQLAELRDRGVAVVVAEVSSHALAQERVSGATFDVAAFTNLSRDHLDYHADFEDYRSAKLRLADLVAEDGALVVNADEPAWSELPHRDRWVRFGMRSEAEYSAREVELGVAGSRWRLHGPDGDAEVKLSLLGEFNVVNALAAAAIAGAAGVDVPAIGEALSSAPPISGRLEILARDPLVLRDFAHTPDALRGALAALRPLASGRTIVVFGCGGDRDPGKRELMGRAAAESADYSIVTSDNPRTEPPEAIVAEILPGLKGAPHEKEVDRRKAIARALELAEPGDVVLLAGKGHETYQIIGSERRPFDEALIVGELLSEREGS